MDLSIVVPTLNGRTQLLRCLDALSAHAPAAEVIVVNGPSTDGTTGAVREREDVDVLVEIADRNPDVARNAGIEHASGEWIAFVSDEYSIEPAWFEALGEAAREEALGMDSRLAAAVPDSLAGAGTALASVTREFADRSKRLATRARAGESADDPSEGPSIDGPSDDAVPAEAESPADDATENPHTRTDDDGTAESVPQKAESDGSEENATSGSQPDGHDPEEPPAAVTGPVHRELTGGTTTQSPESRSVAGRQVTQFNPDNAALRRDALEVVDGFDEYLQVGGARDLAHRLAAGGYDVVWTPGMCVRGEYGADGTGRDLRWDARSLSYRLVKNYGIRPAVLGRVAERTTGDGLSGARGAIRGDLTLSQWFGAARDVALGTTIGTLDGLRARWRDRDRHNPNGKSSRTDRAVTVYDRR
jgi:GT2 family glycosyltransferase